MSARWSDTRALAGDVAPAACGFVVGSQVLLWPLLSRPLASALSPDAAAMGALLAVVAAAGAGLGWDRTPTPARAARPLLPLLPLTGALLGLALAPWSRALAIAGGAAEAGRVAGAVIVLGPAALLTVLVWRGAARWAPFWWGTAAGWGAAFTLAGTIPLWVLLPGASLMALATRRGLSRADAPAVATTTAASGRAATVFAWFCGGLALLGVLRLTLHLGGLQARGRAIVVLTGLVTAALATGVADRLSSRRPSWVSSAMLSAALWALLILAASGGLLPRLLLGMGGGVPPVAALTLALLLLAPVTAGVTVALAARQEAGGRAPGLAALGLGLALLIDEALLPKLIDPSRALVLVVLVLSLGAALQAALALAGRSAWVRAAAAVALGAVALALPPPDLRVLATDLPWDPAAWAPGGRPSVPDRRGRRRLESMRRDGLGVAARVTVAGHPDRVLWRGVPVIARDALEETARFTSGFIVSILHAAPRTAIVYGLDSGALARGLRAGAAGLLVTSRPLTPAVQAVQPPVPTDDAPPPSARAARPDILVLAPPPSWIAGGSAGLSREDLARSLGTLAPGGTLAVRLRPRDFGAREFAASLAAFTEACPASSLWYDGDGLLLIGWVEAPRLDLATIEARFRSALGRDTSGLEQATDVLARFVLPAAGLRVIVADTPADSMWRPLLALAPPPVDPREGESLLARLASLPDEVLALFAQLEARDLDELRTRLEPAARANAHAMAAQGQAPTDPAAALGHIEQALALRPNDPVVRGRAARLLFASALVEAGGGRGAEALARAERAFALDPLIEDHGLLVFELLGRAGREVQAARQLDALALRHPQSYPAQLLLAQRRLDDRDVNAGELFLRRAAETGYETADLLVGFARVAFARGDVAQGRRLVRRAAALGPDPPAVLAYAGGRLLADGQLEDASVFLRESRDLGLENADVLGALGELALQRKDLPEARRLLQSAVDRAPEQPLYRAQLGSILIISGEHAAALPHLEEAVRLIPGDPLVRLNLAVALARAGRVDDARREVLTLGDRLPDNPVLQRLREDLGITDPIAGGAQPGAPSR